MLDAVEEHERYCMKRRGNSAQFLINLVGLKLYEWTAVQSPKNPLVAS